MKIKISDMMCEHCTYTIAKALKKADIPATIDLATKSVEVSDDDFVEAKRAIAAVGYTVSE